jgi:hypothetical protein
MGLSISYGVIQTGRPDELASCSFRGLQNDANSRLQHDSDCLGCVDQLTVIGSAAKRMGLDD